MNGCNHYRTNNSCMRNANNRQPMNNRPRMEMQTDKNMECKRRQQPDKKSLLNEINECSFAVNDMLLIWTHIRVTKQLFLISWNTKTVELPH